MAWIEFHIALRDHWKIKRLSDLMQIEYAHALGYLACLWCWTAQNSPKGYLSEFTDAELCDAARIKATITLKKYLKQVKLLDANDRIHDWGKHGIKLLESTRKRVKEYRLRKRNCNVTVTPTNQPNQPNQPTKPKEIKEDAFDQLLAFNEIFKDYPNKIRDGFARSDFFEHIVNKKYFDLFKKSISNYKIHLSANSWKASLSFSNFLKEWDQWINYVEPVKLDPKAKEAFKKHQELIGVKNG